MPRNAHGRYIEIDQLTHYLELARQEGARYVWISAAGTLVLTRGRTMTPRGVVGHVDVERGVCEMYESEVER